MIWQQPTMKPRPFHVIPRVTHTPQIGWHYLRWGRRLRRIDPALAQRLARALGWAQDAVALACILGTFGGLTLYGVALVAP